MKLHELQKTVESIQIKEDMKERIKNNCRMEDKHMRKVEKKRKYKAAIIAATVFGCIVVSLPVMAVVRSAWLGRMEQMKNKEKEEYVLEFKETKGESDSYSRELSENEKTKMKELREAYFIDGRFPEKKLVSIENIGEVNKDKVCFMTSDSTYYLPEQELTEEEILQIIDFEQKRDYSMQQDMKKANAEIDAKQKKLQGEWEKTGGLTEEEAVQKAAEGVESIFGGFVSGMETKVEYHENTEVFNGRMCQKEYAVWFSQGSLSADGAYYYLVIDAQKREIISASYNDFGREMYQKAGKETANDRELYETVKSDLKEKAGITEEIKVAYLGYVETAKEVKGTLQAVPAEGQVSDTIKYLLVTESGKGYVLEYVYEEKEIFSFYTVNDFKKEIELAGADPVFPVVYLKIE